MNFMTASAKTIITSHSGDILTRNGFGLYINPFRDVGPGHIRFQFDDPTYDPRGNWYRPGAQWVQVSTSPNIWDYWRESTNYYNEFGGISTPSESKIKSPCAVVVANMEGITDIDSAFHYCENIHDIYNFYAPDASARRTFEGCHYLEDCDIIALGENSTEESMYLQTFGNCRSLAKAPFFELSPYATELNGTFAGCTSLVEVPLYDTSHITNSSGLAVGTFENCTSLEHVPLLDTSSMTSMRRMFDGCYSLVDVPLFDTSNVTDMDWMFYGCSSLERVPLFDTSSVREMDNMFYGCSSLEQVPLFDTSLVHDFGYMFYGCTSLKRVPLFNTSSCDASSSNNTCEAMFYGCASVEGGALDLYNRWISQPGGHPYTYEARGPFKNCGIDTQTGLAELQQIPKSWGGLKEE